MLLFIDQFPATAKLTNASFQQYFEIRSKKINKLRETKQPDPYPHKFHVDTDLRKFVK